MSVETGGINRVSHRTRNIAAILVIVAVLIILFVIIPSLAQGTLTIGSFVSPAVVYHTVSVSGTASTTGFGTVPYRVIFTDSNSGAQYTSFVQNGQYSISLSNGVAYNVQIQYTQGLGTQALGTCNAGTMNLNTESSSFSYNAQC